MKLAEAQALRDALTRAIDAAVADGSDTIELLPQLQAMDDAARGELESAIKRASAGG